jgi:hypothetical protein
VIARTVYLLVYRDPCGLGMFEVRSAHETEEGAVRAREEAQKRVTSLNWEGVRGYEVEAVAVLP